MSDQKNTLPYVHLPLGEAVDSFAGYYIPEKEERIDYNGRDVLYVYGHAVVETTCSTGGGCSTADLWYVYVPGYVVAWKKEKNADGLDVSEVERIKDEAAEDEIRKILKEKEMVDKVDFY